MLCFVQSRSARRQRKQSAAADAGAEHVEVDRELWEFLFSHQRSPSASRKSERGAPCSAHRAQTAHSCVQQEFCQALPGESCLGCLPQTLTAPWLCSVAAL